MTPLLNTLDCPQIEVNLSEIEHRDDERNLTLYIRDTSVKLNKTSHLYCNDILKLCTKRTLSDILEQFHENQRGAPNKIAIVSFVCQCLSMLSLLLTFVSFRSYEHYQVKTLWHLFCISFLPNYSSKSALTTCRVMGVVIHYTWLATFGWMAVSAFHMYVSFTNMSVISSSGSKTGHAKVIVQMSHLLAVILVSGCLGYNLATSSGETFGYGRKNCFLNESFDIGLFFALSLGIILVFNTVCFVKTILVIRRVPDMKSVKNRANKTHLNAYCRLSVLLGFTWVFDFVASALQSDVFWYLFVILNGLQGVFIALSYCANKRILQMLKTKVRKQSLPSVTMSTDLSAGASNNPRQSTKV